MKTFKKIVLSTSLIMMALGLLMSMVCLLAGGFRQLSKATIDGAKIMGDDLWGLMKEYSDEVENVIGFDPTFTISTDFYSYNSNSEVLSGDYTDLEIAERSEITKLSLDVAASEVYMKEAEGEYFGIVTEDARKFQYYVDGDRLRIKVGDASLSFGANNTNESITIYVPQGMELKEAEINVGAGMMAQDAEMKVGRLDVSVGAGELDFHNLTADNASVDIGAGKCRFKKASFGETEFSVGAGEVIYSGEFNDDVEVSCAVGSIEMSISGNQDDFDYDMDSTAGSVSIGNSSYSGIGLSKSIDNNCEKEINISCAMGTIDIDFED